MELIGTEHDRKDLLERCAAQHKHLCPRQVLGVQMGLYSARVFGIEMPQEDKRILAFVETDGCFADGLAIATGCTLGHRTMRLIDYGKVAATLVDTLDGRAVRFAPRADVRSRAIAACPHAPNRWRAQLEAYQRFAGEELFSAVEVAMRLDIGALVGKPGVRAICCRCGEEILNLREVVREGETFCRGCAGESYWMAKG
ncbi:MAG: FmdE family protein [Terracidiphilus sp.]